MILYVIGFITVLLISGIFSFLFIDEAICSYRNPYPLFHNGDKKIKELLKNKEKEYKTRSILDDIGYKLWHIVIFIFFIIMLYLNFMKI